MAYPRNNKGVVLLIVLVTLFVIVVLANIILALLSSQSRLTHHQVSRIQAYYADFGAMNYAIDKLRRGDWPMPAAGETNTYRLCRPGTAACDIIDGDLPPAIREVIITVQGRGGTCVPPGPPNDVPVCISCTADYTAIQ